MSNTSKPSYRQWIDNPNNTIEWTWDSVALEEIEVKCERGADKVKHPGHTHYCPKGKKK